MLTGPPPPVFIFPTVLFTGSACRQAGGFFLRFLLCPSQYPFNVKKKKKKKKEKERKKEKKAM